jgi:pyrroloquinoline quinone biosynthesis protein D
MALAARPRLAPHVRLTFDPARERHVLLTPEAVSVPNPTGAAVLDLCDGRRTVEEILAELHERYEGVADDEVRGFLARLLARRWVQTGHGGPGQATGQASGQDSGQAHG